MELSVDEAGLEGGWGGGYVEIEVEETPKEGRERALRMGNWGLGGDVDT